MTFYKEKRTSERHKADASIVCSYYNQNNYFQGRVINCSGNGMYFESNVPFKPGDYICIRLKSGSVIMCEGFRMLSLAEVKWCHKTDDPEHARYRIGVKYIHHT